MTETQDKTVSLFWVRGILDTAESQGVSQIEIFNRATLPTSLLTDRNERISLENTLALWRSAETLTEDPLFGLHMGALLNPSRFQVLSFALLSSETLAHAFDKISKYQRLLSDGGELKLETINEDEVLLSYLPAREGYSRHQIEAVLAMLVNFSRWLTHKHLVPNSINFTHEAQEPLDEYESFFQCEINFKQKQNTISISREMLDYSLAGVDSELAKIHQQIADAELEKLNQKNTVANQVLNELDISGQLHLGREKIARNLAMSGRNLQRKLKEEGTSFQEIYDKKRHKFSINLLEQDMSMEDISETLGFAELSAFYRAFKRWQGITPGEFRKSALKRNTD